MKSRLSSRVNLTLVLWPIVLLGLLYLNIIKTNSDACAHTAAQITTIRSDDFNTCALDPVWDFVNPLGDATYQMTNTFTEDALLLVSVPAGTKHSISDSNTNAPRIMQPAPDADFQVEVKFESLLSEQYQVDGVLVKGAGLDEFLRFDFFSQVVSDSTEIRIYAASLVSATLTPYNDAIITSPAAGEALFMRVERVGDEWTQSYSYYADGPWTDTVTFAHTMTVGAVGVYAGSTSGEGPPETTPAHTGLVDYFFNTDSPITSEDGERNELMVRAVGNGDVDWHPRKPSYSCSEAVTLTATADPGWSFAIWSGGLISRNNPETISMTGSRVIMAVFTQDAYQIFLPIIARSH